MSHAGIRTDLADYTDATEFGSAGELLEEAPGHIGTIGRLLAAGLDLRDLARDLGVTQAEAKALRAQARRWLRYRRAGLGSPGPLRV